MKKTLTFAAIAAALLAGASCSKVGQPASSQETGTINISVSPEQTTKASYTETAGNEATVTTIQILVFDDSTNLVRYLAPETTTASVQVVAGKTYDVYAVVNGPDLSSVKNTATLNDTSIPLKEYNDTTTGFVMAGNVSVSAIPDMAVQANITVERFVSRVTLQKLTYNGEDPNFTVKSVFLSNVVASQKIGSATADTTYINQYGRKGGYNGTIITTSSDCDSLTLRTFTGTMQKGDVNEDKKLMYAYPNKTKYDRTTDDLVEGVFNDWLNTSTRLVVCATYYGEDYYYPVVLNQDGDESFGRNKAYTVEMTINGPGLDDPQEDPSHFKKGTINANVIVGDWVSGYVYDISY